tara:strand:+ start:295 stop:615 length:321 start_codon:yes stop_codon:yes gene_type:complete
MTQTINSVEVSDFNFIDTTVSVNVTASKKTETFHVQTVGGEYRSSCGCWIFTGENGDDLDRDDYPDFDFTEIIQAAEEEAEESVGDREKNPNYLNKDASPYTHRFL